MTMADEINRLRATKMIHHKWYRAEYPDVILLDMASTEHYLRFGAAMGRNPNRNFDTKFYVAQNLGNGLGAQNPVLHFFDKGKNLPTKEVDHSADAAANLIDPVSYTHLTLPTTPYV